MSDQESFISHLVELRQRLVRAVGVMLVVFLGLMFWPGSSAIYDFLAVPLMSALPPDSKMIATGVVSPFMVPIKVTALASFVIALPFVLYQAWAFVAPGLYEHEKKLALPLVVASTLLFVAGMGFCYYIVFEQVFTVIHQWAPQSITPAPDIEAYFSFVLTMFLAFGITFESPVVVLVLVRVGLVSLESLRQARPYVIVGAFVVAAVVTPPDVLSQFMLAVPMCILYEAGIFLARFITVRPKAEEEGKHDPLTP